MASFSLFEVYGIEAEYMIVDKKTLKVLPLTEYVLRELSGGELDDVEIDDVCWSNELVSHVIEIKFATPLGENELHGADLRFANAIRRVNLILEKKGAMLLPSAMHPFMNPLKETELWPHGHRKIYNQFDKIFSCKGHGWSNLQSVHINLPFNGDSEFGKLHAAIRPILPLIPFLAASSPYYEGKRGENLDNRLHFYEQNQKRVPLITGDVIPEQIFSIAEYEVLLQKIFKQIDPLDQEKILQHQWLNSRGAILKFDLNAIEIRLMDIQESPYMDFALIHFITALVKDVTLNERKNQVARGLNTSMLKSLYDAGVRGDRTVSVTSSYAEIFGVKERVSMDKFLGQLFELYKKDIPEKFHHGIETILVHGNLATRLLHASNSPRQEDYEQLGELLQKNGIYEG